MNFQGKVPYQKGRDGLPVPSFLRELSLNFGGRGRSSQLAVVSLQIPKAAKFII